MYSKCSGLGLIAFSKASAHSFLYGGQAYYNYVKQIIMYVSYHVVSSTSGTDNDAGAVKMLDSYNNVIRNEYTVPSTNLAPEYYQKNQQTMPNPCKKNLN